MADETPKSKKTETPKSKFYRVRVTNEFRATTSANRLTAGLSVPQDGDGLVAELTNDQLAELNDDQYVTVEPAKA